MNVFGNSSRGSGLDEQNSFWKTEENPRTGWNQNSPYNIVNYKAWMGLTDAHI